MPELKGDWNHNSYLVNPKQDFLDQSPSPNSPPIAVESFKWAKGVLRVDDAQAGSGRLEFAPGVELSVNFTLQADAEGLTFTARGVGKTGPLVGVEYRLAGWAIVGSDGEISSLEGGIQALKGGGSNGQLGLGGQPVGTIGYFRLSK